jgi:prophage maintenance system killer protein
MSSFLVLNEYDLEALQEEKVLTFLQLAAGQMSVTELANWIRIHLKPTIDSKQG